MAKRNVEFSATPKVIAFNTTRIANVHEKEIIKYKSRLVSICEKSETIAFELSRNV